MKKGIYSFILAFITFTLIVLFMIGLHVYGAIMWKILILGACFLLLWFVWYVTL